jgi:hypothetical protein
MLRIGKALNKNNAFDMPIAIEASDFLQVRSTNGRLLTLFRCRKTSQNGSQ